MSSIRVSGNTSGYYDLIVPDVAGTNTIPLNQVVTTDSNGHIQISGGSTNNDDTAAVITAASTEHAKIRIDTSSTSNHRATLAMESGSYEVNIATSGLDEMRFSTQNTSDAFFIGSNGHVGIGTTIPYRHLEVLSPTDGQIMGVGTSAGGGQGITFDVHTTGDPRVVMNNNSSSHFAMAFNTNGIERMRIHPDGYVTTPNQPGVNVAPLSTESGTYNNSANNNQYCIWTSIRWQTGNNYNTSNGVFTAPVTGKYYVSFHSNWYNNNAGTWIMPQVYKNGSVWEQWYHNTANHGSWIQIQGATIVDAAQNDTIRLYKQTQSGSGGGADVGNYASFVVRLVG